MTHVRFEYLDNNTQIGWRPLPVENIKYWDGEIIVKYGRFRVLVDGEIVYES